MRKCKKCHETKPIEDFQIVNKIHGWRRWECKKCTSERHHQWMRESKNQIRVKLSSRKYYKNNRQKVIDKAAKWNREHCDRHNEVAMEYYYRTQHEAIMAYGGYVCACCGETEPLFLTIDHINNDGNKHRKKFQSTGDGLYKWLKRHNYPEGFQVLCMNCNHGKRRNGGICPHKAIYIGINKLVKGTCRDYPERE